MEDMTFLALFYAQTCGKVVVELLAGNWNNVVLLAPFSTGQQQNFIMIHWEGDDP